MSSKSSLAPFQNYSFTAHGAILGGHRLKEFRKKGLRLLLQYAKEADPRVYQDGRDQDARLLQ